MMVWVGSNQIEMRKQNNMLNLMILERKNGEMKEEIREEITSAWPPVCRTAEST